MKYHVLAWVVHNPAESDKFELHAQIHEKGRYTNRAFGIDGRVREDTYTVPKTGQTIKANSL